MTTSTPLLNGDHMSEPILHDFKFFQNYLNYMNITVLKHFIWLQLNDTTTVCNSRNLCTFHLNKKIGIHELCIITPVLNFREIHN